jgi:surface protein
VSEINYDPDTDRASAVFSAEIQNIQLGPNCETISVTNQGFVYGYDIQPTIDNNVVNVNGQNPSFVANNLGAETTYYVRAYLTNVLGTFYGNEVSFTTPQSTSPVYLGANGITIKARDWANIGDVGVVNGVEYTVVDRVMLDLMLANDEDLTVVCTSSVTGMSFMFYNSAFNQDIGNWDTSSVTGMVSMFYANSAFNQDIGNWDTSSVTDMSFMFNSSVFNQDLSMWNVVNVTECSSFSYNTPSWTLPQPNFTNCTP